MSRNRHGPRMRRVEARRKRQIRRWQVNHLAARIERHRPRTNLGLNDLRKFELVRRHFANNRQGPVAAAREHQAVAETGRIDERANREIRHDLSVVGVHHDQLLVAATDKQPPRRAIHRHSSRLAARRGRPSRDDFHLLRIDDRDLILVHDIDVNLAGLVGDRELRRSAQIQSRRRLATCSDSRPARSRPADAHRRTSPARDCWRGHR